MITMSILWALIICLFIMNPESPNNHRIGSAIKILCRNFNNHRHIRKGDHENEITMSHRDGLGLLVLVRATQSADRNLVRLPRRVSFVEVEEANDDNRCLRNKRV